jgi:hypothetical protein
MLHLIICYTKEFSCLMSYFKITFTLPCQFTIILMFSAIKAISTTLLQAIYIKKTCIRQSVSKITPTLPSLSTGSSVQLSGHVPVKV